MRILLLVVMASGLVGADLKIGIIGTDTSHAVAFTELLNNPSAEGHVPGGRVVAAFPGGSPDVESSRTRIDRFTETLRTRYKVEIVKDIPALLARVDAVLLESVDGRVHLEQVRPVFAARKRVFLDKPLAATYLDAKEIARQGRESGVPWFSTSSSRYSTPFAEWKQHEVVGAVTWGPAPIEPHHQLELSWYGIHAVEMLFTLMGRGCETVTHTSTEGADVVVGRWKDGRIGLVRAGRKGKSSSEYGAMVFGPDRVHSAGPIEGSFYTELMHEVIRFFQTGVPPVPNEETLEIFAFMDAAQRSKAAGGRPMRVEP